MMHEILYHLTALDNVPNIISIGLIPNFKKGLTVWEEDQKDRRVVWLTDDPSYVLEMQAGFDWPHAILRVDCYGLAIKPYRVRLRPDSMTTVPHEFQYDDVIYPERIEIYNG